MDLSHNGEHAMNASVLPRTAISAVGFRAHLGRLLVTGLLATLLGCATVPERTPLPLELTNKASIPGIPDARFWGDEWPKFAMQMFETSSSAELREKKSREYTASHTTTLPSPAVAPTGRLAPGCWWGGRRPVRARSSPW